MTGSERPATTTPFTLAEAAVRHGAFAWTEHRLFELTGAWAAAPTVPDEARAPLFTTSSQHAWHAEMWMERLPVLATVDRAALVRPAGSRAPALVDLLDVDGHFAEAAGAAGAVERFFHGLGRVLLPGLLGAYETFAERLGEVADGPSMRTLSLVEGDIVVEIEWIEALFGSGALRASGTAGADDLDGAPAGSGAPDAELFSWSELDSAVVVERGESRA